MIVKSFYYVTLPVNINALSRNYGGIMFGVANAMGSVSGIIGNYIIGAVTKHVSLVKRSQTYSLLSKNLTPNSEVYSPVFHH